MTERVQQRVTDIGDHRQLVRYAVAGQVARLDFEQKEVARCLGVSETAFTKMLNGTQKIPDDVLKDLDGLTVTFLRGRPHTGELISHAVRVRGLEEIAPLATIQSSWTDDYFARPPSQDIDVLGRGSVLLEELIRVQRSGRNYHNVLDLNLFRKTVHQLMLVGGSPPTSRNIDALTLLGGLSSYAFDVTREPLDEALHNSPLGFRVWRAVAKLVRLSGGATASQLRPWVTNLLQQAEALREDSIYPGRSLDVELAITVPPTWTPSHWVGQMLRDRMNNPTASLRERATAAHALWARAVKSPGGDNPELRQELQRFGSGNEREEITTGLRWVQATLQSVMATGITVCNDWPKLDEPWLKCVHEVADSLELYGIPPNILPGTKSLFRHGLLQNSGVERRLALDTLVAGGWAEDVTNAFSQVLARVTDESWLRIRALFALGFLQTPTLHVRETLAKACRSAYEQLVPTVRSDDNLPISLSLASELHAAFFAVGDCFGTQAKQAQEQSPIIRQQLSDVLIDMVEDRRWSARSELRLAMRSAAYLLLMTAQKRDPANLKQDDLSKRLLWKMHEIPELDRKTRDLCHWALRFRFDDENGRNAIRPIFDGPVRIRG